MTSAPLPPHRTAPTGAVLHGTLPLMPLARTVGRGLWSVLLVVVGAPIIMAAWCAAWVAGCAVVGFGAYGVILLGQAIIGA